MSWTRAIHLAHWADTELAPRHFPLLIRKLVRSTVPSITKLRIPANEQTNRPGFDGLVECENGNAFVPGGRSVWELGTNQHPESKANRDYEKRTKETSAEERSNTIFVFATPRTWQKRDEWSAKKAEAGSWKGVIALDSDDIEHWLELARGVDAWISCETGQIPSSVQSLQSHWRALRDIGEHVLNPTVFTGSRDSEIESIVRLLEGTPDSLFLQTAGLSDGIDFLAALAAERSEDFWEQDQSVEPTSLTFLQDGLIVFSIDDWRQLILSTGALLLIASPNLELSATDISAAVQKGHRVLVSGPRGIVPPWPAPKTCTTGYESTGWVMPLPPRSGAVA